MVTMRHIESITKPTIVTPKKALDIIDSQNFIHAEYYSHLLHNRCLWDGELGYIDGKIIAVRYDEAGADEHGSDL